MTEFTAVDLSQLPAPAVIEPLDFEAIFSAMLDDLQTRDPLFDALVESDPAYAILQVAAYRELLLRQRINEAARANLLAFAKKADLDNLVAFYNVKRLQTDPGDPEAIPPIEPSFETDEELLRRAQAAMHGFSTAGPERAYIYHALSADGRALDVSAQSPQFSHAELDPDLAEQLPPGVIVLQVDDDAGLTQPKPGDVAIRILARDGDGTAPVDLQTAVANYLNQESVRPLTDQVRVASADIVPFQLIAEVTPYDGAGADLAVDNARARVNAYLADTRKLGRSHYRSAIIAALHAPGIEHVNLISPIDDLELARYQAAHCTELSVINRTETARTEATDD